MGYRTGFISDVSRTSTACILLWSRGVAARLFAKLLVRDLVVLRYTHPDRAKDLRHGDE